MIEYSAKIGKLPPYPFAELQRLKSEQMARGVDIIDLGVGDPDLPTPEIIVEAARAALTDPQYQKYALARGLPEFRQAIADWCARRFGLRLDPWREVCPLIGSKEGIAHLPQAFLAPDDYVLCPDPYYPAYVGGTIFAGGQLYYLPLLAQNRFLPDLDAIPTAVLEHSKILFLNYPNNPSGAVATAGFFRRVVEFATQHHLIVAHDNAYSEFGFDGYVAPGFLETPGGMEVGIEFFSLSKTFSMSGWRVGFAIGNATIIEGLVRVKNSHDTGACLAFQKAAATALQQAEHLAPATVAIYQERRDALVQRFADNGLKIEAPPATPYLWLTIPESCADAMIWARRLLLEAGVMVTAGNSLGASGARYYRLSLMASQARLLEAADRICALI